MGMNKKGKCLLDFIDFPFTICNAKESNNGEDSFLLHLDNDLTVCCVCDGCGGAGAKKYSVFQGKTGAYLASRIVTGTIKDCIPSCLINNDERFVTFLKESINNNLQLVQNLGGTRSGLKGRLRKELSNTLAANYITASNDKALNIHCVWAGDSRCYLLDLDGLHQLTKDDLNDLDAMDNLTADGVMTNCISLSRDYQLHSKSMNASFPGIIIAASDGCFSYYSTPMEFEFLLISTLLRSRSVIDWERQLETMLSMVAADDFTMSGISFGFGSFSNLKRAFVSRRNELFNEYIENLNKLSNEQRHSKWLDYKENYLRFLSI